MKRLPEFDCHCHILPGLDDGSASLDESLTLCRWLVKRGYKRAVCTSHSSFLYRNSPRTVIPACRALQEELDAQGIPLRLMPSLEYRLIPETWPSLRKGNGLLPWEGNHLLVELPIRHREQMGDLDMLSEIRSLIEDGYKPVLAHPERYLWANNRDYETLLDTGIAFQRNLGSIEGAYGAAVASRARFILQHGWYSFLGTDLHNIKYTEIFDGILDRQ